MRKLTFSLAATFCLSVATVHAAGVQLIEISSGDRTQTLDGAVWSPCDTPPVTMVLRRTEVPGAKDCPVVGNQLPLVVISHGGRGWYGGHHDTAAALADSGFVVAAVTHPDADGRRWQTDRPAAIKKLIDFMLNEWSGHAQLDGGRIGFFGFSRGGYTGLVLIGGEPDFRRVVPHCQQVPSDPICTPQKGTKAQRRSKSAADALPFTHDPRIKAAVIAAPLGLVFSPEGLEDVTVPVQLWRPENDELAIHPYNAEAVYQALPVEADYRVVSGAGHFTVLAPCTELQAQAIPALCQDEDGFDRVAFHKEFNAEILVFFQKHLAKP